MVRLSDCRVRAVVERGWVLRRGSSEGISGQPRHPVRREHRQGTGGRPRGRRWVSRWQGRGQSPSPFSTASGTIVPDLPSPTGPRAGDYTYREGLEHKCKRDTLLGRLRSAEDQTWKRIRPRPTKTSFVGSYYLCKGGWAAAGAGGTAKGPAAHSRPGLCTSPQADRQTGVVWRGWSPCRNKQLRP